MGKLTFVSGLRYERIELERENRAYGQVDKNDLDGVVPGIRVSYQISNSKSVFCGVCIKRVLVLLHLSEPSSNTSQDPRRELKL